MQMVLKLAIEPDGVQKTLVHEKYTHRISVLDLLDQSLCAH